MIRRMFHDRPAVLAACAFIAFLIVTYMVYRPGLSGGFLFDDMVNLDALGRLGGIDSWPTLIDYLLGSHTGTGGRPITLATFLLDGVGWPTDPRPFKHTNILFHLLTMVGVIWLSLQIAGALGYDRRHQYAIALIAGAAWGLHPYLVSTVLYIVQRMAILAGLFVVFGLSCYVRGRRLLADNSARAGYVWMTIGIALFTPLAFFSKPNGGLLPALALVLDATVLCRLTAPADQLRRWHLWRGVFLYLPIATIIGYFLVNWESRILSGYASRPFSLTERLLTEGRILVDYVANLLIPRIQTSGLYYDNYQISTSLLDPWTTLPCILAVVGAAIAGVVLRRRRSIISAALLFFLVGHIIESSFIPLELYFEHRNYLPTVLAAFALAVGIVRLWDYSALDRARTISAISVTALIATLGTFTYARATLWGNPSRQALTWASENPGSIRAQQQAAITFMRHGQPQQAAEHISDAIQHNPDSSLLRIQYLLATCEYNQFKQVRLDQAVESIGRSWFQSYTIEHIEALGQHAAQGTCAGLDVTDVLRLTDAALEHPGVQSNGSMMEQLHYVRGSLLLRDGEPARAFKSFMLAARAARNHEGAIRMATTMASHEQFEYALTLLDHAENDLALATPGLRAQMRRTALDYRSEIRRLRQEIRAKARARE